MYIFSCILFKFIHIKFHTFHRIHMEFTFFITFSDNGNCTLSIRSPWDVYVNIKLIVLHSACRLHRTYGKRIVKQMIIDEIDPIHPIKLMEYQFHSRLQIDAPIFHFCKTICQFLVAFRMERRRKNKCKTVYENESSIVFSNECFAMKPFTCSFGRATELGQIANEWRNLNSVYDSDSLFAISFLQRCS